MTFSSCSTTHTQFPASASFRNILIKFPTSLPCKPIVGSSNANIASVSEEPRQVVRLTLCVSPPLSVLVERSRVKYPRPTSWRYCSLCFIPSRARFIFWSLAGISFGKRDDSLLTGIEYNSGRDMPFHFHKMDSSPNLLPLHAVHSKYPLYFDRNTRMCILYVFFSTHLKKLSIPYHFEDPSW